MDEITLEDLGDKPTVPTAPPAPQAQPAGGEGEITLDDLGDNTPQPQEKPVLEKAVETEEPADGSEPIKVFTHALGKASSDFIDGLSMVSEARQGYMDMGLRAAINGVSQLVAGRNIVDVVTPEDVSKRIDDAGIPIANTINGMLGGEVMPTKQDMKEYLDDRGDFMDMPLSEEVAYGLGNAMTFLPAFRGTAVMTNTIGASRTAMVVGGVQSGLESGIMSAGAGDDKMNVLVNAGVGVAVGGLSIGAISMVKNHLGKDTLKLVETAHIKKAEKILDKAATEANPKYMKQRDAWVQASVYDKWEDIPVLDRVVYASSQSETGKFVLEGLNTSMGLAEKRANLKTVTEGEIKDTIKGNTPNVADTTPIKASNTDTLETVVHNTELKAVKLSDFIHDSIQHPESVTYEALKDALGGNLSRVDKIQANLNKVEKQGFINIATQAKDAHMTLEPSLLYNKAMEGIPTGSPQEEQIIKTALSRVLGIDGNEIAGNMAEVDINAGHIIEAYMDLPNIAVSKDMSKSPDYQALRENLAKIVDELAPGTGAGETLRNITKTSAAKNRVFDAVLGKNGVLDANLLRKTEINSLYNRMINADETKTFDDFASMFPREQRGQIELGIIRSHLEAKTPVGVDHMDTSGDVSGSIAKDLESISSSFKTKEAKTMMKYLDYNTQVAKNLEGKLGIQREYKTTGKRELWTAIWDNAKGLVGTHLSDETFIKTESIVKHLSKDIALRSTGDRVPTHTLASVKTGSSIKDSDMKLMTTTNKMIDHINGMTEYNEIFMELPKNLRKSVFLNGGKDFGFLHMNPADRGKVADIAKKAYEKLQGNKSEEFIKMNEARKPIQGSLENSTFGYSMDKDGYMAWDVNLPFKMLSSGEDGLELLGGKEPLIKGIMGILYDNEAKLVKDIGSSDLSKYKILIRKGEGDGISMNGDSLTINLSDLPKKGKDYDRETISRKATTQLRQYLDTMSRNKDGMSAVISRLLAVSNTKSGGL